MKENKLDHLEERIEKPGYLLFLVVVLLFLIIGFVNLLDFDSKTPVLFGRYSILYFGMIVAYFVGMLAWASLLLRPNDDRWLRKSLDFVQKRPIIAIGILVVFAAIFVHMYRDKHWLDLPALQVTLIVIMLLFSGLILFYRWGDETRPQLWRKFIVYPVVALVGLELILQALALVGILPSITTQDEATAPYARIYYTEEGFNSSLGNNYGWNYPNFELRPDSYRILLLGDSFVRAFSVAPEDHMGVLLQQFINENAPDDQPVEVLAVGTQDYGPGVYLDYLASEAAVETFDPDEIVVFFDLANDFQLTESAAEEDIYYRLIENAEFDPNVWDSDIEIHPDDWLVQHLLIHDLLYNYDGFQLVRFLRSNYLTLRLAETLLGTPAVSADTAESLPTTAVSLPNGFVFDPSTNDEAMEIAKRLVKRGISYLQVHQDVPVSLVTIPVFTDEFLAQSDWNTQFGTADLLLPEQELREFAAENNIPFLGLGAYMAANGTTPDDVKELYFKDGRGHFTPDGHSLAATAVFDCFFAQSAPADLGCDVP